MNEKNDKKEPKTETKAVTTEKVPAKRATATPRAKKAATAASAAPEPRSKRPATAPLRLVEAPPDKAFWVNYGPIVHNLRGLRDALAYSVTDEQFDHHTGEGRHDFARWVEDVLRDAECATALRRAKTREAAVRAVETALKRYA